MLRLIRLMDKAMGLPQTPYTLESPDSAELPVIADNVDDFEHTML